MLEASSKQIEPIPGKIRPEANTFTINAKWQAMIRDCPNLIVCLDTHGVVVEATIPKHLASEIKPSMLLGKSLSSLVNAAEAQELQSHLAQIFSQKSDSLVTKLNIFSESNQPLSFEAILSELSEDGCLKGYLVIMRDITAEIDRQKNFEQLTDALGDFIIETDLNATITKINRVLPPAQNPNDAIGYSLYHFVPESNHHVLKETLSSVRKTHKPAVYEIEACGPNGDPAWWENFVSPTFGRGELKGFTFVCRNITERKETAIALENACKVKSEMISRMNHKIRTPLGIMLGYAEILKDFAHTREDVASSAESILQSGRQLTELIDQMLNYERKIRQKFRPKNTEVNFIDLTSTIIDSVKSEYENHKDILIDVSYDPALPSRIILDSHRFSQIFIKLLRNSVRFTNCGTVAVRFTSNQTNDDRYLLIEFEDSGKGMNFRDQLCVFKPFVKKSESTIATLGESLTLADARLIARQMGGDLELIKSTKNTGTIFQLKVPYALKQTVSSKTPDQPLKGTKLLLVEDNADNRLLIQSFLKNAGAQVKTTQNGQEGVTTALSEDFDLIIMDLQMPEMDGYEATKALRDNHCTKPIVALTAHALPGDRKKALANGFNDYVTKPFHPSDLIRCVTDLKDQTETTRHPPQ